MFERVKLALDILSIFLVRNLCPIDPSPMLAPEPPAAPPWYPRRYHGPADRIGNLMAHSYPVGRSKHRPARELNKKRAFCSIGVVELQANRAAAEEFAASY